jgi:signal transduction histidine kinase
MLADQQRISEHDLVATFYVLLEGEVAVTRGADGSEEILSAGAAAIDNQTPVLIATPPRVTNIRALRPCRFLRADADTYLEHVAGWSASNSIIVGSLTRRVHDTVALLRQKEMLAALGKLSAGLAHELNNPASAALRATDHLRDCIDILAGVGSYETTTDEADALIKLEDELLERLASMKQVDPLSLAEREDSIASRLTAGGVRDGWKIAPGLAEAGVDISWLDAVAALTEPHHLDELLTRFDARLRAVRLLDQIERSTARISDLVGALKAYTYLDQAPVQEVDLHLGLENTLVILNHKLLPGIAVHREYDPALPRITALGSALNQVWTVLIENAIDAVGGKGNIWLRTACREEQVIVEVVDDGHGIPADLQPHIFTPFITAKAQEAGAGMGLHTAYNIVVNRHRGALSFTSQPGATGFRVELPVRSSALDE